MGKAEVREGETGRPRGRWEGGRGTRRGKWRRQEGVEEAEEGMKDGA